MAPIDFWGGVAGWSLVWAGLACGVGEPWGTMFSLLHRRLRILARFNEILTKILNNSEFTTVFIQTHTINKGSVFRIALSYLDRKCCSEIVS